MGKILLISEQMAGNQDEGLKLFVSHIYAHFSANHEVQLFSQDDGEHRLSGNLFLLGVNTSQLVQESLPVDGVFYIPRATSANLGSFLRCWILQRYFDKVPVGFVVLQQSQWSRWKKILSFQLWPRCVFFSTQAEVNMATSRGHPAFLIRSGVDSERFCPGSFCERLQTRQAYHLDPAKPLFLHVGHLKYTRGLALLLDLKRAIDCEILVVTSTTTHDDRDRELKRELEQNGIHIHSEYIPNVEKIYQAADCYLFPVIHSGDAIALPLSVLEAMACNLPVVSYPFGELPNQFSGAQGLFFAQDPHDFVSKAIRAIEQPADVDTRGLVRHLTWLSASEELLQKLAKASRPEVYSG